MRLSTFAVGSGLLALVQVVAAFSDTAPLLAYSSAEASFDRLRVAKRDARGPSALYSRDVARALIKDNQGHVCDLDGIALIEVEDVNASRSSGTTGQLTPDHPHSFTTTVSPNCMARTQSRRPSRVLNRHLASSTYPSTLGLLLTRSNGRFTKLASETKTGSPPREARSAKRASEHSSNTKRASGNSKVSRGLLPCGLCARLTAF